MNIAFIGFGKFGRAIASLAEYNGYEYDYAEAAESRLLSKPAEIVFLTVPVQHLREALADNAAMLKKDTVVVNCAKGIEEGTHLLAHEIVAEAGDYPNYYSLLGPSFASEIEKQYPTAVSLGYITQEYVEDIKRVLETPYFQIQELQGCEALELASALKNVYAIACGYAEGLGYAANTRARLIVMALQEFSVLIDAMKLQSVSMASPGVVGDLVLTCSSRQSRNYQYGVNLATSSEAAKAELHGHTVEGFYTSHSVSQLATHHRAELPLATLTADIISGKVRGRKAFTEFLADR
jgi:glycerol-3-phosphate dehydrogenase (NAD(P)+)